MTRRKVMFHGVLTANKDLTRLMIAASHLPDIDFWIIGDGPEKKALKKSAPDNVQFFGWVEKRFIDDYIKKCDIGVALRSDNPGNEYVVTSPFLQYGKMGKPCLVTRRRVFGNYPWQFDTVDELVEKIKILLDRPEEGEKLRKHVFKNHNAKDIADQIWSILK